MKSETEVDEGHGSSSHITKNRPVTKEDTAAGKGPEVMPDCLNKGDPEEEEIKCCPTLESILPWRLSKVVCNVVSCNWLMIRSHVLLIQ